MKTYLLLLSLFSSVFCTAQLEEKRIDDLRHQEALAPFYHGVASGDPAFNKVILWTRYTPDSTQLQPVQLSYTIATDTSFSNIVQQGIVEANPLNDFIAKIDASGLSPNTYYYFVFTAPDGRNSLIGRTKTTALNDYEHFRAATLSCTSIYSGYFNGYARIAERNDLDVVIHTGDYLYDFVDGNGNNRVPDPYPEVPKDLKSWRDRHYYYELDPDLIKARQQHPFVVIWDNHDVDDYDNNALSYKSANQSFFEWIPIRLNQVQLIDTLITYRHLQFGNLVDLFLLDCYSFGDSPVGSNANTVFTPELDDTSRTYLGKIQRSWLFSEIKKSTANWRIFGSQKLMSPWCLGCFPDISDMVDFPTINDQGNVFNTRAWDGYPKERQKLFTVLKEKGTKNNVVVSGDAHLAFFADLTDKPFNPLEYNPITGGNSVGVELLPSSLTRENLDEIIASEGSGKPGMEYYYAAEALANASVLANIHHAYTNFSDHGYGLLDITPERVVGEFWVSEKIEPSTSEELKRSHTCDSETGHWNRIPNFSATPGKDFQADPAPLTPPKKGSITGIRENNNLLNKQIGNIYPNPTTGSFTIDRGAIEGVLKVEIYDVRSALIKTIIYKVKEPLKIDLLAMSNGTYFARIYYGNMSVLRKFVLKK